ncbi:MAG TPA: hypothetical protein VEU62_13305 [Bryobacterales bacterium]|nr:hypothetical protein [Bryobacterales bacterium]
MKRAWVCSGLILLMAPFAVLAQTSGSDAETIRELLARVQQLEKRVAELESQRGAPAGPAAAAPQAAPAAPAQAAAPLTPEQMVHQEHLRAEAGSQILPQSPLLHMQGFSDFNFSATSQHGTTSGFNEGQFVLHVSSALSSRVNVFSEISLTARRDAGVGSPPAPGFNPEVERLLIRFDQSDYFKVSFGRYHTPINYWNTAFHHGQWLQTSISRPEMTQFGGNFIPVHFVGGLVEGEIPASGLHLNYNAGLGNGRGSVISRGGDFGDINNNRAWLVNLFVKPDRLYGLQTGGSVYRDKISILGRNFDEWITSGNIVWLKEKPEFIAEIANVKHAEIGRPGGSNSLAYYVQVGYRLPWFEQLWKPYYRWEYIHVPRADTVFSAVPSLAGSVVGVRYDITTFAAIKAEWRNQRRPGLERINGAFVQTSFTF